MRCISPACRISTYSSRLLPVIARNFTRSSRGLAGSSASSRTRRLNCIQDASRPLKIFCFLAAFRVIGSVQNASVSYLAVYRFSPREGQGNPWSPSTVPDQNRTPDQSVQQGAESGSTSMRQLNLRQFPDSRQVRPFVHHQTQPCSLGIPRSLGHPLKNLSGQFCLFGGRHRLVAQQERHPKTADARSHVEDRALLELQGE